MAALMLVIPHLLNELPATGRWPQTDAQANSQNLKPLVDPERVKGLATEESLIYLYPPPFVTVRERCNKGDDFWTWPMADPKGIDFDLAIDIGDFGIGSDAPILLDYRHDLANPRVIRLRWVRDGDPSSNRWVAMAPDFQSFVESLGL
jgi:hypothetical protein